VASFAENAADKEGNPKERPDFKSTLRAPPTFEFITYLLMSGACLGAWAWSALAVNAGQLVLDQNAKLGLAFAAGFGPVLAAYVFAKDKKPPSVDAKAFKSTFWGDIVQFTVGTAFCSLPISMACYLAY
jgi:hypothetical protein